MADTKWCGAENISTHYNDLGVFEQTDMCCRDHDDCKDIILAGQSKDGLTNEAPYTRLHCDCDLKFRECLQNDESLPNFIIGFIYFTVLGTKCYKSEYPITGCYSYSGIIHTKCSGYEVDDSKLKKYQWFDVPNYF